MAGKINLTITNNLGDSDATKFQKAIGTELEAEYIKLAEDLAEKIGAVGGEWQLLIGGEASKETANVSLAYLDEKTGYGFTDGARGIRIQRTFRKGPKGVALTNDLMTLGPTIRGNGLADVINKVGSDILLKNGGKSVHVHANLDVGGYTWLRKGVWPSGGKELIDRLIQRGKPYRNQTEELTAALKRWGELKTIKDYKEFVQSDHFRQFKPQFLGSDWHGVADVSKAETYRSFTKSEPQPKAAGTSAKGVTPAVVPKPIPEAAQPTKDTKVTFMQKVAGGREEVTRTLGEIGVSPEVHARVQKQLDKLAETYGVGPPHLKGIAYTDELTSDFDGFTKRVTLTTHGMKGSWAEAEAALADSATVSNGGKGLTSLVDHEFAHALDSQIKQGLSDEGYAEWKASQKALRDKLGDPSEYAKRNANEWFAERFTLEHGGGVADRSLIEGVIRPYRERIPGTHRIPSLPKVSASATANEIYRDASLRHQIGVRRYSAGLTTKVSRLLETADRDLAEKLRLRLARFEGRPLDVTSERWKAMLGDFRETRAAMMGEYKTLVRGELGELSKMEGAREASLLGSSVPIEISFATVAADQLRAIATSKPFQGKLLGDWFKTLEQADQARLTQAIQLGMVQGEPVDDIVRRVVGTRANQYADGILATTRRDAQAIVRTAVNHVSNTARSYVWDANEDIISARVWVSTLDGRTSPICQARDGHGAAVGGNALPEGIEPLTPPEAKPPAHINCRSVMVGYIDGVGLLGNRPVVTDTRTRAKREVDFRKLAKQSGRPIKEVRADWAAENVGRVPAKTTYQEFLSRQPAAFQDEVLGRSRGVLFRKGGMKLDQFVDRGGRELTLSQLAATQPEAFARAGL